jgi:hypothetical protein
MSDLRNEGVQIEESTQRDAYGFSFHRLKAHTREEDLKIAADAIADFNQQT